MYVRPRARFRPRNAGGAPFSPASLFTGGVAGAWYDPSDYSTLFQDSAGTTPVTAVEQPVGLMLDKSQGLVLGSELVTTTSMVAQNANGTVTVVGSTLVATCTVNGLYGARFSPAPGVVIGSNYFVTVTISTNSASKAVLMDFGGYSSRTITSTTGSQTFRLSAVSGTTISIYVQSGVAGESFTISLISVRELPGNHALQATAASRPVLRARYNLLTYSEQFDNAAWSKASATVTANATTAPDGTTTADSIRADATTYPSTFVTVTTVASTSYTLSIYAKSNTTSQLSMEFRGAGGTPDAVFNLSSGTVTSGTGAIVSVGNGWYRCSITKTSVDASEIAIIGLGFAPAVNDSIYIWGAQLVTGSSAGTYQRIAAATDYATAGFLPYLYFDGSDDYLTIANTNDLNFGQGSFWAQTGLTSLGASQYDVVWGKSSASSDNIRLFLVSTDNLGVCWGTDAQFYTGSTFQITKNTAQIQEWGVNSSGSTAFYALNGTENTPAITLSGTGSNSSPAYIGINNNLTQYQTQMNLYGMILRKGTLPTAAQRTASRNWMAAKSGVTL